MSILPATSHAATAAPHRRTVLHLEASPRGPSSRSTSAAAALVEAMRERDPAVEIDRLDLWATELPPFDGAMIAAKYARLAGIAHGPEEAAAWAVIEAFVARVARADRVLISTPIWNFGIPYRLKHWIDLVTQPGLTFRFDPDNGYSPLLTNRPTLVVLASAGDYATGASHGRPDLATPYLRAALGFIGLADPIIVPVAPTIGPKATDATAEAERRLRGMAASFLARAS